MSLSLFSGNRTPNVGGNAIKEAYLGSRLVYQSAKPYLEFVGTEPFRISLPYKQQNGWNLEYSLDGNQWTSWSGSTINATSKVCFRGTGNSHIQKYTNVYAYRSTFSITSTSGGTYNGYIDTFGDVARLLDYQTDPRDVTMDTYAFYDLFYKMTSLRTPPSLGALNLAAYCYCEMFYGCSNLESLPELPATVLPAGCYYVMFMGCTNIRLYETQYEGGKGFRIPSTGDAVSVGFHALNGMFNSTDGAILNPSVNTQYYVGGEEPRYYIIKDGEYQNGSAASSRGSYTTVTKNSGYISYKWTRTSGNYFILSIPISFQEAISLGYNYVIIDCKVGSTYYGFKLKAYADNSSSVNTGSTIVEFTSDPVTSRKKLKGAFTSLSSTYASKKYIKLVGTGYDYDEEGSYSTSSGQIDIYNIYFAKE